MRPTYIFLPILHGMGRGFVIFTSLTHPLFCPSFINGYTYQYSSHVFTCRSFPQALAPARRANPLYYWAWKMLHTLHLRGDSVFTGDPER